MSELHDKTSYEFAVAVFEKYGAIDYFNKLVKEARKNYQENPDHDIIPFELVDDVKNAVFHDDDIDTELRDNILDDMNQDYYCDNCGKFSTTGNLCSCWQCQTCGWLTEYGSTTEYFECGRCKNCFEHESNEICITCEHRDNCEYYIDNQDEIEEMCEA